MFDCIMSIVPDPYTMCRPIIETHFQDPFAGDFSHSIEREREREREKKKMQRESAVERGDP